MEHPQIRTELLLGKQGLETLAGDHVLVVGLGGVGGHAAEALVRSGIGRLTIVDHDLVSISHFNRQLCALRSTLGRPKARVMAERLLDINPLLDLTVLDEFLLPDEAEGLIHRGGFRYVADCIDTVASKAALIAACRQWNVPVISSLGSGNRLDPTRISLAYLDEVDDDDLTRVLREQLRALKIDLHIPVIWSSEAPHRPERPGQASAGREAGGRSIDGTVGYMPASFGLMLAGYIVRRLLAVNPRA